MHLGSVDPAQSDLGGDLHARPDIHPRLERVAVEHAQHFGRMSAARHRGLRRRLISTARLPAGDSHAPVLSPAAKQAAAKISMPRRCGAAKDLSVRNIIREISFGGAIRPANNL
jgi:hypothetical protein